MGTEILFEELQDMRAAYGEVATTTGAGGQVLIRIDRVELPKGCNPAGTPVLLAWPAGQARPQIVVKPGIKLPNGASPRSTSTLQLEGEAWMQFSYAFTWHKDSHTLMQLVETAMRRFANSE
jgi:hypothetical protein